MTHWLRQLFDRPPTPAAKPSRASLGLQRLEDREVPAVTLGSLDPLFDGDGIQTYNLAGINNDDAGTAVAIQSDGKIVVAGSNRYSTNDYDWAIWRYNANGSLDTTFDDDGFRAINFTADGGGALDARARAVAIQSDGKIVVGGFSSTATNGRDMTVIRLNTNGLLDTTFDTDGIWTRPTRFGGNDEINSLAIQGDGKIVTAGYYTFSGADTDFRVTRLTPTGGIDSTMDEVVAFDAGGGNTDVATGVALQSDGKVVVVGHVTSTSSGTNFALVRLNATGGLDSSFDGDGKVSFNFDTANGNYFDYANCVAVQSDGKIVVAGNAQTPTTIGEDIAVARLNANGSFDTTFDTDGKVTFSILNGSFDGVGAVVLQADGKIVLAGTSNVPSTSQFDMTLARLNTNGSLDTTFSGDGKQAYDAALTTGVGNLAGVALDASGRIVAVGNATTTSTGTDVQILRVFGNNIPLVVDSTADVADGNLSAGNLSFREAVALANSAADADTITFAPALTGATITLGSQLTLTTAIAISGGTTGVTISGGNATRLFNVDDGSSGTQRAVTLSGLRLIGGNGSSGEGGAVFNQENLTLANCTLTNNSSPSFGGAIRNADSGTLTIDNSTLASNTAMGAGGAIYTSGTLSVRNSTLTANRSDSDNSGSQAGGGIATFNGGGTTTTLRNTIVYGNFQGSGTTANDLGEKNVQSPASINNLIGTGSAGLSNGTNGNQVGVNPLLGTLGTSGGLTPVYPLLAGSPAINAGSNSAASGLTADGRGAPFVRTSGGTVDIGAFEMQALAVVVDNTGDADDGNFAAGQLTLREAVRLSQNPGADTITFAAGLGPVVLTTAQLSLTDTSGATTISGPSGGTQVVQRSTAGGTPNFRLFRVNSGVTAAFNNLTMSNGNITGSGPSGSGAGISNSGTLTLTNSTVSGNTAAAYAGGIDNDAGTLTVTNSTFSGNTASGNDGGGISSNTSLTVANSTFSGNTAGGSGGGIYVFNGTATLTNATVTGNRSDNNNSGGETGGGVYRNNGTVTLNNTLVAGNFRGTGTTRDDVRGAVAGTSANNLIGDGTNLTGITNGSGGNLIGTAGSPINPLLQPLGNNGGPTQTHALGQNSPALGKASASVAGYSVYDQRGTARDLGAADIGAYEVQHPLAPVGVPATNALLFAPKPSATANEAFVKGLYQGLLLRAPDAGGLANWLTNLGNGMTREQVANGFVNSTENRTNQVTFYYRYFLGREPDTGGLNDWVGRLQSGQDEGTVMTGFILSPEFSNNNSNPQFVHLMYYALLGREADTGGLNDWLDKLNNQGWTREGVVTFFLRSTESLNRVVRSLFEAYLKREADAGAITNFRTALLGGTTFGQAATSILGGQEFFNNATNNMN